ncbi:hypothetical protein FRC01_010087 [Tulasnella sp. 417]|nr:hypothetical protein FRC01_010087 [Tulasnella sp. 417]
MQSKLRLQILLHPKIAGGKIKKDGDTGTIITPEYIDAFINSAVLGLTKTIAGVNNKRVEIALPYLS